MKDILIAALAGFIFVITCAGLLHLMLYLITLGYIK